MPSKDSAKINVDYEPPWHIVIINYMFILLSAWTTCSTNSRVAGDLRRRDPHVMSLY